MLLAIDIGNTNIDVGFFSGDTLCAHASIGADRKRTSDEYALLLRALAEMHGQSLGAAEQVILGSVVPPLTPILKDAVGRLTNAPVTEVGPGIKTGFSIRLDDPSELGADLAANAAGAIRRFGAPVLIVDCGTATTVSAIDRNGAYVGCVILPGIGMSLGALHQTGLLPDVVAKAPSDCIGRNSEESMRIGVIRGQALAILGFLTEQRAKLSLDEHTPVVLTGGYAPLLLPYLPAATKHQPSLTLEGLCTIAAANKRKK